MNELLSVLKSSNKDTVRCREMAAMAPYLFLASLVGISFLHVFSSLSYQATIMGGAAGVSSALGHLGLAVKNQRLQYVSLVLLAFSVLFFPTSPKSSFGWLVFNGLISAVGLFSAIFICLLFLQWRRK